MPSNPLWHSDDPASSVAAAGGITASGARNRHAAIVYALVAQSPGCTAVELLKRQTGDGRLSEYQIRRRLTDLQHSGCIRRGPLRKCRVRSTDMLTWYVDGKFSLPVSARSTLRQRYSALLSALKIVSATFKNNGVRRAALDYILSRAESDRIVRVARVRRILEDLDCA